MIIKGKREEAQAFYHNEVLWEAARIDGFFIEDMVRILTEEDCDHLIWKDMGKVGCVTSYKPIREDSLEVHTFVLPVYKMISADILEEHMMFFKKRGYKFLYTACSSRNTAVLNFLIKRLGFSVYGFDSSSKITVDGHVIGIHSLIKEL